MEIEQAIDRRKGRAMAQTLEEFENECEPRLPAAVATAFKAFVRRKLNAFASDVTELVKAEREGWVKNAAAQDIEDRLFADTRATQGQRGS